MAIEATSAASTASTSVKKTSGEMESERMREKFAKGLNMEIMNKNVGEIVSDLEQAEEIVVTKAREKVEAVDKKLTSLMTFQTNTIGLQSVASLLKGVDVGVLQTPGAFAEPDTYLVSGDEKALTMTVTSEAKPDEIKVVINQIARKDTVSAKAAVADANVALGWVGDLEINGKTFTFTATQSLNQIKNILNNATSETGVTANITQIDGGNLLSFKANNFAQPVMVDATALTCNPEQVPSTAGVKEIPDLNASAIGWDGNLKINGHNISLTAGLNAEQIRDAINLETAQTGVTARLQAANSGYYFVFETTANVSPATIDASGLTYSSSGNIDQIPRTTTPTADQLSAKVIFRDTGLVKTYTTNTITDQVPGATFNLNTSSTYPATVTVGIRYNAVTPTTIMFGRDVTDVTGTSQKSELDKGFIDKWNDYIDYMKSQEAYKGQLTSQLQQTVSLAFSGAVSGIPEGELSTAAQLGITIQADGKIKADRNLWDTNITSKFEQVKNALGFNWTIPDSAVQLAQRPKVLNSDIAGKSIDISIKKLANGTAEATMTYTKITKLPDGTPVSTPTTITLENGTKINNAMVFSGPKGSVFENVKIVFGEMNNLTDGGPARTTTLKMTQGYMDHLSGELDQVLNGQNSGFTQEKDNITAEKDAKDFKVEELMARKEQRMERYRAQFARLEVIYLQLKQAQDYVKTHLMTAFANAA